MAESPTEPTRILIVDDDSSVRDVIAVLLARGGLRVSRPCRRRRRRSTRRAHAEFSLAISDVRMPGKDGFWLLDRLRELHPDIAVIMLTAFGDTEAAVECLRNGAADYLLKPPKVTDLIRAIERALGRRRLELARQRYRKSLENRVREKTAELSRTLARSAGDLLADALVARRRARRARARDERPLAARRPLHARRRAAARDRRSATCPTSAAARSCTTSARSACPTRSS